VYTDREPLYYAKVSTTIAFGATSTVLNSELEKELKAKGVDPFAIMAELALDTSDPDLRFAAAKELARYLRPQLKSIDVRVAGQTQRNFAIVKFSDVDPARAAALAKGLTPKALLEQLVPNAAVIQHTRMEMEAPISAEDENAVVTEPAVIPSEDDVEDVVELPRKMRYR
jgi:hypothetical protein